MGIWSQQNGKSQECSPSGERDPHKDAQRRKNAKAKRPSQEIREALEEIKAAYTVLVSKHEAFTMYLNDEEYAEAETWMVST